MSAVATLALVLLVGDGLGEDVRPAVAADADSTGCTAAYDASYSGRG